MPAPFDRDGLCEVFHTIGDRMGVRIKKFLQKWEAKEEPLQVDAIALSSLVDEPSLRGRILPRNVMIGRTVNTRGAFKNTEHSQDS
jgi:hypothetical protein